MRQRSKPISPAILMFAHDLEKIGVLTEASITSIKEIGRKEWNGMIHPTLPVPSLSELILLSPAQLEIRSWDSVDVSGNDIQSPIKKERGKERGNRYESAMRCFNFFNFFFLFFFPLFFEGFMSRRGICGSSAWSWRPSV